MQVLIMQAPLVFDSQAHTGLNIRPKALMPTHRVVCYTLDFQQVCHLPRIDLQAQSQWRFLAVVDTSQSESDCPLHKLQSTDSTRGNAKDILCTLAACRLVH